MKSFSSYSSEDDGNFNENNSEEEDYDFLDEQESMKTHEKEPKLQNDDKKLVHDENQSKTDKTIYDLADVSSDSDSENFQINSSNSYSENEINSINENNSSKNIETKEEKIEIKPNQGLIDKTNAADLYLSAMKESDSESDDDNFKENFRNTSNENTETEYSDIEDLKKKLKSKQNGNPKDFNELKILFSSIIELIPPYNNASEALSNSIKDDIKAQKITDVATQLLFMGKYNIYSCNIEQLKVELNDLQKDI